MVRVISVKLKEELLIKLDLFAVNRKMSRSEVIRKAIEKYILDEQIPKKTVTKEI